MTYIEMVEHVPHHQRDVKVRREDIQLVLATMELPARYAIAAGMAVMERMSMFSGEIQLTAYDLYLAMATPPIWGPALGLRPDQSGVPSVPLHHAVGVFAAARLVRMRNRREAA